MRVFTTLPQENLQKVGPAAQAIEAAGYTGVSTQENKHDPFLSLAVAGAATRLIELHTSVAIAFARSPMTCANIGWDLAASTGGRFTLGLGSQIRAHNERRFSVPWTAPAPRMREYVQAIRAIWAAWKGDGKLNYEGKHYRFTLMTPNFTASSMSRSAFGCDTPLVEPVPMATRSYINIAVAWFQPLLSVPTNALFGIRTSVKKISLKCLPPSI